MFCERCTREIESAGPEVRPVLSSLNLRALPFVPAADYRFLPRCGAVYFVLAPGKICYIGSALDLAKRWQFHGLLARLLVEPEAQIAWLAQSEKPQRDEIEKEAIRYFRPVWNFGGDEYLSSVQIREQFPNAKEIRFRAREEQERLEFLVSHTSVAVDWADINSPG